MQANYVVTGTLVDGGTIALDERLPMTAQRVRLVVEPINAEAGRPLQAVLAAIHARQTARQHRTPTRQEIDAFLEQERMS